MIDATGRRKYTNREAVDTMPRGEGDEVDFCFFKPEPEEYTRPGFMSEEDLEKALKIRNLISDPYAQAKANEDDPAFADEHPNGAHWKGADGKWYYVAFGRGRGGRSVSCVRGGDGWDGRWWFGGVPSK